MQPVVGLMVEKGGSFVGGLLATQTQSQPDRVVREWTLLFDTAPFTGIDSLERSF